MPDTRRATIYFEGDVHRALKLKAAAADRTISELVNEAVRESLAEDAIDLAAASQRVGEPSIAFEAFVRELRERGRI